MEEHPNGVIVRSAYEALGRGDVAAFASLLADDIVWHESAAGFEGDYQGRDETLALLGRVFQESGVEMNNVSIHDILANDEHAAVLHETTMTLRGRTTTGQYADIYHVANGKITEHWHLAVDPIADEELFVG